MPTVLRRYPYPVRLAGALCIGLPACLLVLAAPARADTVPPSIRTCIGEADAGRRLACYDREVARLIAPADTFTQAPPAAPPMTSPVTAPAGAQVRTLPAAAPAAAAPAAPATAAPPRHLEAKVHTVRQSGDYLVITLDNGDVWEQYEPATSPLNLRPGDPVQLDRGLGAWLLSNRYGDTLKVRLQKPAQ